MEREVLCVDGEIELEPRCRFVGGRFEEDEEVEELRSEGRFGDIQVDQLTE
jgi:hypothetical protein